MDKILVILPCFNVEQYCEELVNISKSNAEKFDFLFVDDCSEDKTELLLNNAGMKVISLKKHGGKSEALKNGFDYALANGYKYIITMDSDLQHDANDLDKLLNKMKESQSDIIIAQRSIDLSKMPMSRFMSNFLSSKIISYLIGQKITDSQCGYRLIKSDYLNLNTQFKGFQYETEFLVKSVWAGAKLNFIQTATIYNNSKSSMRYFTDTVSFIRLFSYLFFEKSKRG